MERAVKLRNVNLISVYEIYTSAWIRAIRSVEIYRQHRLRLVISPCVKNTNRRILQGDPIERQIHLV